MSANKRFAMLAAICCLVLAPAAAFAGKKVSKNGVSLQLSSSVSPHKAGAKGVKVHIHVDYRFATASERQKANTKEVRLTLAPGMKINPSAAGQCTSAAALAGTSVAGCPKSSIVGSGTVVIDARPTVAKPLNGTVTLYNYKGHHHDVLFWFSVPFGGKPITGSEVYLILSKGKTEYLSYVASPPATGSTSLYSLRTADLTLRNASTGKAYITAPAACTGGSWPFSFMVSNYSGAPNLTATDKATCTR